MAETSPVFTGYAFRTSSRFGSYFEVTVVDGLVTITGRRASKEARDGWIGLQAGLIGAVYASAVSCILGRRRACRRFWGLAFVEYLVAALGALLVWWPADRGPNGLLHGRSPETREAGAELARSSYESWSFPVGQVLRADVSRWYWGRGLWYVAWPWQLLMVLTPDTNRGFVVEIAAPEEERPRKRLVFAGNMDTPEMAAGFVMALKAREA